MALACAPRPQAARRIRHGIAAQRSRIRTLPSLRYGMISRIDLKAVALMRFFLNALSRAILARSEEHTSELQSQSNLVCRLLLEKKKKKKQKKKTLIKDKNI